MRWAIHDLKRRDCLWNSVPLSTYTGFIIKLSFNADKIIQIIIILHTPLLPCTPLKKPKIQTKPRSNSSDFFFHGEVWKNIKQ